MLSSAGVEPFQKHCVGAKRRLVPWLRIMGYETALSKLTKRGTSRQVARVDEWWPQLSWPGDGPRRVRKLRYSNVVGLPHPAVSGRRGARGAV